jgi:microcin C transport system substrate-binding protein
VPYVLLWASDHNRILYWRKFGTPEYVLDKYNREDAIVPYWYVDPEQKRKLETNMDSGDPLDPVPYDVHYAE